MSRKNPTKVSIIKPEETEMDERVKTMLKLNRQSTVKECDKQKKIYSAMTSLQVERK